MLQTAASIINLYSNTAAASSHSLLKLKETGQLPYLRTACTYDCIWVAVKFKMHLLWYVLRTCAHAHTKIIVLPVGWDRCCEKNIYLYTLGLETVPAVPMSCHFCSPAAINLVTACVSQWWCACARMFPRLRCLLSFSNKGKSRSHLN